jgi:glycosyltransferase involved in cell wall biosynthesis
MCVGLRGKSLASRVPIRVAFTNIPRRIWAGGHNYQNNLFVLLNRHFPGEVLPVVFAGLGDDPADLAAIAQIPGVEIVRSAAFDRRRLGLATALALGLDRAAAAEFRANRIDVVFESARFFGWRLPYPAIAWFPDFQHRRLPHFFSPVVRWRRELGFRAQIGAGRMILLSSQSALRDFRRFYPGATSDISVVRFATWPAASSLSADPQAVIAHYNLPSRYFYLPNQFWRHKNHQVAINALAILKRRGLEVVIAASGSKDDPRELNYFDDLMKEVARHGLEKNFRYLGMIPLAHVYALLRSSTALINPSRIEGWSTTVEEAKSFGVPMILSDIDVHREQTNGMARCFGADDAEALANHLSDSLQDGAPVVPRELVSAIDDRAGAFATDFVTMIRRMGLQQGGDTLQYRSKMK